MRTISSIKELKAFRQANSFEKTTGFVPTMGALHEGHLSLCRRSMDENDFSIASIFINPTQFDSSVDLESYPSCLEKDLEVLERMGISAVFLPNDQDMYHDNFAYQLQETSFSEKLCGANRPGHFTGMLTVVMKLLNLVWPNRAYFGKKDYQQLELIRGMCAAFFLDVEIVGVETVRDSEGLALSSRNALLNEEGLKMARKLNKMLAVGDADDVVSSKLSEEGLLVDYVETHKGRRYGAVRAPGKAGSIRLIDNVTLEASV